MGSSVNSAVPFSAEDSSPMNWGRKLVKERKIETWMMEQRDHLVVREMLLEVVEYEFFTCLISFGYQINLENHQKGNDHASREN